MFETLTNRLNDVFRNLRGRGKITEDNVVEAMRQVRTALLEADVNLEVARRFCDEVQAKAIGQEVIKTLKPDQLMVKIVHDELVELMGPVDPRVPFVTPGPTVLLMAGLQGSGKTTTCAKMARLLLNQAKRPLMVAADLKRPAAIDQLETLGGQVGVPVYAERDHQNAVKVCRNGIAEARKTDRDVVILDTAGRLAIDDELMHEIEQVATTCAPHQIYLVLDAMTGQDAVHTAKAFNDRLELDGCILTKFDSDTRGGAALSVKRVTGKPIKFIGVGEKLDALEEFHPQRIAGRILGMGDIVSLVEKAQQQYSREEAAKLEERMSKGRFSLEDFLAQLRKMKQMGSMKDLLKKLPGMGDALADQEVDDGELVRMEAAILSMTPKERNNPKLIDASRRRRIARGAGVDPQEVSGLVKQFETMRNMMKVMAGKSLLERMRMGTQLSKLATEGGALPKFKSSTAATKRVLSKKDKRKRRRR
ncbi:MAG TPA: signal recognition particle protein [Phycisphaerae bacterium]|nr:signal recognition particle protein [Phycisphaerae bacterium]HNU45320.1 signal recognition particle protein [Phycisphaerae bacterium]